MRLKLIKTLAGGAVQEFNYAYGFETQAGEIDFSEDFGAPVISGRRIKFNYKTNALRPVSDASYEMRLVELQNVSYTNSSGFLYNYSLAQNVAGFFNIFTAAQTKTAEPVFSPAAGSFDAEIYASMSCATPGATVRYTLDSSTPSQSHGTIFNNVPILIASSTVVKAVAYKEGLLPSAAVAASYVINKVSAPEFSPAPGVYSVPKQITLTSKTPGASIYYTEDASANPSRSSALYQGPFFISSSKVIKAVAVKDGMKDSNIVSAEYVINKTEAPQFNPPSGTYAGAQNITLFSQTAGAVIRYTTDGSEPNDSSPAYSGPIAVSNVGTNEIKAVAYKNGLAASAVSSAVYVILARVETPSFNPAPGIYDSARDVAITCATVGASIYYSLDGSAPSRSSALYTAPVRVASSLKLSAIAVKSGMADSFVESGAYTINVPQVSKPVIYPSSGTYGAVQHVTISCVTAGASIYYTLDETVPTASSTPYSGTIEVSQTSYIKAVAVKPGMLDSPHAESYIIINMPRPKVENPQFSPAAGSYTGAQQAAITCATAGSEIYYTLDGSRPTSSKTRYTAPFSVTANSTVKAIAIKQPLLSDSDVVTAEYFIRIPKPSFSLPAGDYTDEKTLILSTGVQGASIYYTTNGSEPTADYQNLYSAPIVISRSMTVKAMAAKPGMLYSETATAAYVLKVKMPSFAPPAGNYMDTQSVTISCQTPNAAVHYTIDGSEPTAASALFTSPIIVAHNLTIKAVGVKSGLVNSDVAVAAYTVQPKAAKPQLIPPGGVYNSARSVTITTATAGAAVKYTLDGTEPSISSATYSGAINVSAATEIRAIAVKSGMLNSDTARETYVIDNALQMVETPSFAPPGGVYNSAQNVTISSATSGADIYYTLDGSYPGVSSQKYLTPLSVDSSRTIRAIAVKQGMAYSAEASASYVIKAAAPSFTPAAGTYNGAQNITITSATAGAIIKYTLDGSEPGASVGLTYSQPVAVTQNVTLKAIAIKNGMANSDVSSAAYSIRVEAPVMSLDTGTYEGDRSVAITCATPGAS
ncbi:MAG TPA: chitobiase/beta-hexosaminidase C-terminal domain-containing protein, partial [Candidatus Wallbacteria bacterium]|nr:chitobiase/beta-hexosaminidase C-terminal domain-containing protein [Candidatus Wallbacteria bacterium]